MKANELLKFETNSQTYKRLLKKKREQKSEIFCGYCPYHSNENRYFRDFTVRNWKRYRRHQWKEVDFLLDIED